MPLPFEDVWQDIMGLGKTRFDPKTGAVLDEYGRPVPLDKVSREAAAAVLDFDPDQPAAARAADAAALTRRYRAGAEGAAREAERRSAAIASLPQGQEFGGGAGNKVFAREGGPLVTSDAAGRPAPGPGRLVAPPAGPPSVSGAAAWADPLGVAGMTEADVRAFLAQAPESPEDRLAREGRKFQAQIAPPVAPPQGTFGSREEARADLRRRGSEGLPVYRAGGRYVYDEAGERGALGASTSPADQLEFLRQTMPEAFRPAQRPAPPVSDIFHGVASS